MTDAATRSEHQRITLAQELAWRAYWRAVAEYRGLPYLP